MLSYLLQLKFIWISFSIFFLTIFANFHIFLKIYHLVVFIAKLWDDSLILVMTFLLLKLSKFRYLSFLKSSFVCEKVLFVFISVNESLDATIVEIELARD